MIIEDSFVFIHIPKTAGKALERHFNVAPDTRLKHLPLRNKIKDIKGRKIFCNIRNPWDWYVSRYFHGLTPSSAIARGSDRTKSRIPEARKVLRKLGYNIDLYKDYEKFEINKLFMKKEIFNRYLNHIFRDSKSLSEDKLFSVPNVGALTYAYFDMCAKIKIPREAKIRDVFERHNSLIGVDKVLKLEEFPDNMFEFLGIQKDQIKDQNKLSSFRSHHYSHYYDDDTLKLIEEKEKFIINEFDYEFEDRN